MTQRFEKYDFEVLLLEGSYVSDPKVRRAVIEDGGDRCSVEEYSSRCFRRLGYSALRVENEPTKAAKGLHLPPGAGRWASPRYILSIEPATASVGNVCRSSDTYLQDWQRRSSRCS